MSYMRTPKFPPGQIVTTYAANAALEKSHQTTRDLLARHLSGDWGDVDNIDNIANKKAIRDGGRIFSSYTLHDEYTIVWVITEAVNHTGHRTFTTILLASEYKKG